MGTTLNPDLIITQDRTGDSFLRFVHGVENLGQVDVYVDRNPLFDSIGYKTGTLYFCLNFTMDHIIQIFPVGLSSQPLAEISVTIVPMSFNTLTLSGTTTNVTAQIFVDNIKSEVGAKFRLINLISDYVNTIEASMNLNNAPTVLATNAVYLQNNPYNPIPVGTNSICIGPSHSTEDWIKFNYQFNNGSYYTIFAMGSVSNNSTTAVTLLDSPTNLNITKPPKSASNPERVLQIFSILSICICVYLFAL